MSKLVRRTVPPYSTISLIYPELVFEVEKKLNEFFPTCTFLDPEVHLIAYKILRYRAVSFLYAGEQGNENEKVRPARTKPTTPTFRSGRALTLQDRISVNVFFRKNGEIILKFYQDRRRKTL